MKKIIQIRSMAAGGFLWLALAAMAVFPSCSSTENLSDDTNEGKGQVRVSLVVVSDTAEQSLTKAQAAPQTVTVPVKDGWGMVCTLAPEKASKERTTQQMTLGNKYRMVAYNTATPTVVAGTTTFIATTSEGSAAALYLAPGNYNFVFYSFNNANAPGVPDGAGKVSVPAGSDLLWYSTTGTVTAGNVLSLPVTFAHQLSSVRVAANSFGLGASITAVSATLNNSYPVTLTALSGSLAAGTVSTVPVAWTDAASQLRTSSLNPIYTNGATSLTVTFPANGTTIGGVTNTTDKAVTFSGWTMTPGVRYTLNVRFFKCGAYVAPGVWKPFMCHNLGADYTADPFTPSYKLNGAYWQWGNLSYSAAAPTDASGSDWAGPVPGWGVNNYSIDPTAWNSGTEASPVKNTANDPCPNGYRIPTQTEWVNVVNNNSSQVIGNWVADPAEYTSARTFYTTSPSNPTLLLPTTGWRQGDNAAPGYGLGQLYNRGFNAAYWSATAENSAVGRVLQFSSFMMDPVTIDNSIEPKQDGVTIRCIAE